MSSVSEPSLHTAQPSRSSSWLHARPLWAAVSIVVMWLAVLFVGVFGGDFVSSNSSGLTKIPVVVFLLPFVLPATVVVGRRGFASDSDERDAVAEPAPRTREEPTGETSTLRATPA